LEYILKSVTEKDDHYLNGILELQQENLPKNISAEEKSKEGFVTVEHSFETISQLAKNLPQFVAVNANDKVVGYVLAMDENTKAIIPVLQPMFSLFNSLEYNSIQLSTQKIVVCGQACIDKEFRGIGLVGKLYNFMRENLHKQFECCVTEIATSNVRSRSAHKKVGFEEIHSFNDGKEDWEVVYWNWK
jgi:L-amino acid N-acyltransferase YncA